MAKKKGIVLNFRDGNTYTDEEVLARIKEAIDNNESSSSRSIPLMALRPITRCLT